MHLWHIHDCKNTHSACSIFMLLKALFFCQMASALHDELREMALEVTSCSIDLGRKQHFLPFFSMCCIRLYTDFYILEKIKEVDFDVVFLAFVISIAKKNYSAADCVWEKKRRQFFRQNGKSNNSCKCCNQQFICCTHNTQAICRAENSCWI